MKKVLMLGNSESVKGGITTVISQFREHQWEGINVKFIPTYKDNNAIVKIIFFMIAYVRIIFYCIFCKPDIVHMHMSYKASFTRAYIIHKLCKKLKIKDIIHLHGSEFKNWYESVNQRKKCKVRKLLRECDKMIVLGSEWEKIIRTIEPETNILIVNNTVSIPIDNAKFNTEKYRILYLGVLIKRKGLDDLIEAVKILEEKNILKNTIFTIAGEGAEEKNLKEKVKLLQLSDYIEFTGWIDSKQKQLLLRESQLMVLPSYNEGLPMCILEACSYGLPIISTNVGDICEVVKNGENGFIFEKANVNELAKKLQVMIEIGKEEWNKMSETSKKIVEQNFSSTKYFELFQKIYIEL